MMPLNNVYSTVINHPVYSIVGFSTLIIATLLIRRSYRIGKEAENSRRPYNCLTIRLPTEMTFPDEAPNNTNELNT